MDPMSRQSRAAASKRVASEYQGVTTKILKIVADNRGRITVLVSRTVGDTFIADDVLAIFMSQYSRSRLTECRNARSRAPGGPAISICNLAAS
jgi:hypothetical protein